MRKLWRREEGAAALELGIILPLLLVFLAFVSPLIKFGYEYMVLQRAAAHGVRFATRADVNPRLGPDGTLTRRPNGTEVAQFVSDSSNGRVDAARVTIDPPNPALALPGEQVTVSLDYDVSYGPLAEIVNAVRTTFFGGGASLPSSTEVTVSARGREE